LWARPTTSPAPHQPILVRIVPISGSSSPRSLRRPGLRPVAVGFPVRYSSTAQRPGGAEGQQMVLGASTAMDAVQRGVWWSRWVPRLPDRYQRALAERDQAGLRKTVGCGTATTEGRSPNQNTSAATPSPARPVRRRPSSLSTTSMSSRGSRTKFWRKIGPPRLCTFTPIHT
jgi:hypothetical protein